MTLEIFLLLALLVAVMVVMTAEWLPVDLVTIGVVLVLVLTGVLTPAEAFAGFASEFIFVLAAIFVLSGALARTGIMEWLGVALYRIGGAKESGAVAMIMGLSASSSAFLSNTNVTAVLMPAVLEFARKSGLSASRLLIPLAYASMLGGASTLIGTSTNLAANGLLERAGLRPFSVFEFVIVGVVMTVLGTAYMSVIGRRFLPKSDSGSLSDDYDLHEYVTEMRLDDESGLVGQTLEEAPLIESGVRVLAIGRDGDRHMPDPRERLRAGDLLIVQGTQEALFGLDEQPGATLQARHELQDEDLLAGGAQIAEAVVMPRSAAIGKTVRQLRLRQRYGVSVVAIHRRGHAHPAGVRDLPLGAADVLLLRGAKEQMELLAATLNVWIVGEVDHVPFRRRRGVTLLAAMVGAIVAAAAGWLPLSVALLLAVFVVVVTNVIKVEDVYQLVEWPLIVLIGGMTSVGLAMQKTGAADFLAGGLTSVFLPFGIVATMAAFALVTMLLTQPLSNAAAALVVLPVAISAAAPMGVDARSLAVLVTLSASLSFIAPLEPACLLVFAPGKYRFGDFIKAGLPMTLIALAVLLLVVPLVWPLR